MCAGNAATLALAWGWVELPLGHIQLSLVSFIYTIFAQALVMFYFIGVARLTENVRFRLTEKGADPGELFEGSPPQDLEPYLRKSYQFLLDARRAKRQTIPWTMLMLALGSIAFLLGGAHHTGLVSRSAHAGVAYGFAVAMVIGLFRQWHYLGRGNRLLRKLKGLFELPDGQM